MQRIAQKKSKNRSEHHHRHEHTMIPIRLEDAQKKKSLTTDYSRFSQSQTTSLSPGTVVLPVRFPSQPRSIKRLSKSREFDPFIPTPQNQTPLPPGITSVAAIDVGFARIAVKNSLNFVGECTKNGLKGMGWVLPAGICQGGMIESRMCTRVQSGAAV